MAIAIPLALIATGCKQQGASEKSPIAVKVMKVNPVSISGGQEFSGTIEEASGSTLSFSVPGTVRQIRVVAGQKVNRGELIATLDEATLLSAYDAAAATLDQAEDAYRRMKQLHENNSLPEIQWVEVQSKLKQAQATEKISEKNLSDARLYAPFSGVISEKAVEVGHNVLPGVPVVKLVKTDRVKVNISVPENEISHINIGQHVHVDVSALDGKSFTGKVSEKGISANALSRSYEVKALIDNPAGELMPGMICTLRIGQEKETATIVLPANIVQMDEANRHFVWVNDHGKAQKRVIEIGTLVRNGVQVGSGLSAGEEVLTEGCQKVSNGMNIKVIGEHRDE